MKTLADFPNQVHITSVLRASLIRDELARIYVLVGGERKERLELKIAFFEAACCFNIHLPKYQGLPCQDCVACLQGIQSRGYGHTDIFDFDSLSEVDEDVVKQATVFELKSSELSQEPIYVATTALLLVMVRRATEDVLAAVKEYLGVYTYKQLTETMLAVLRDCLTIKYGVELPASNKGTNYLAHALSHFYFVRLIERIWEAQDKNTVDELLFAQSLCLLMVDIIKPSLPKPIETPITIVEEPASMSYEDMVSWVKET